MVLLTGVDRVGSGISSGGAFARAGAILLSFSFDGIRRAALSNCSALGGHIVVGATGRGWWGRDGNRQPATVDWCRNAGPSQADGSRSDGCGAPATPTAVDLKREVVTVRSATTAAGTGAHYPVVFFVAREDLVLDEADDLPQRELFPTDAARQRIGSHFFRLCLAWQQQQHNSNNKKEKKNEEDWKTTPEIQEEEEEKEKRKKKTSKTMWNQPSVATPKTLERG